VKTYTLTGKAPKCSGQARLVFDAFKSLGQTNLHAVAAWLEANGLRTVQTSERIAAYYISVFKSSGVVREVEIIDHTEETEQIDLNATIWE
jgi:hypothetical protein